MPARPLYRRLLEKCQGRVARADLGWAAKPTSDQLTEKDFKDMASNAEWSEWVQSQQEAENVRVLDLFVEYILE